MEPFAASPPPAPVDANPGRSAALRELARLFLRLGASAFGGPAAHIAMMQDEVVRRRRWLTDERFLDMLGVTNLIPGPNSTEMALHVGYVRAGIAGLLVAGVSFIVPAALMVMGLAWAYVRFGALPQAAGLLYGAKPVVIAVVVQALWSLGRAAVKTRLLGVLGLISAVLYLSGINEIAVLFIGALLAIVIEGMLRREISGTASGLNAAVAALPIAKAAAAGATVVPFTMLRLFLFFLKIGSVMFGSGYVLLAFLRSGLVERWHWLTEAQLLDAVAIGQITPGPLSTTATFIGYILKGPAGAAVATVGIFLPAFVLVAILGPILPRIRQSPTAGAMLDGVNVAALALMTIVTFQLGRAAIIDVTTAATAIAAAVLLIRFRINSAWLMLAGGALGWLVAG